MTALSRKARGMRTQLVGCEYLRPVFPNIESAGSGRGGEDMLNTEHVSGEVKARTGFEPLTAMRQAEKAAGGKMPFILLRMNGQGEKNIGEWLIVLRFSWFRAILHLLKQHGALGHVAKRMKDLEEAEENK